MAIIAGGVADSDRLLTHLACTDDLLLIDKSLDKIKGMHRSLGAAFDVLLLNVKVKKVALWSNNAGLRNRVVEAHTSMEVWGRVSSPRAQRSRCCTCVSPHGRSIVPA